MESFIYYTLLVVTNKMKYMPPESGPYEANLTAKSLYDLVAGLIRPHFTREEIERVSFDLQAKELWKQSSIRSELEEFIQSYFFSNLRLPMPGFVEIFTSDLQNTEKNLRSYTTRLEVQLGSDEAKRQIAQLFGELKKRGDWFSQETKGIEALEEDRLLKYTAIDRFGNLGIYYKIQALMKSLGLA